MTRAADLTRRRVTQVHKATRALRSPLHRRALRLGVAPAIEHAALIGVLDAGSLVDVGCNRGQFSLEFRAHHSSAPIVAFEPLPAAAAVARQVFADDAGFDLHEAGLGSAPATLRLNVAGHDDSSSFLPIGALQSTTFAGTAVTTTVEVPVGRLDDFELDLPGPTLLKLDVQGYELEALRGAEATLTRTEWIYLEVSFREFYHGQPLADEVVGTVREMGFGLSGIGSTMAVGGQVVQADLLFARR